MRRTHRLVQNTETLSLVINVMILRQLCGQPPARSSSRSVSRLRSRSPQPSRLRPLRVTGWNYYSPRHLIEIDFSETRLRPCAQSADVCNMAGSFRRGPSLTPAPPTTWLAPSRQPASLMGGLYRHGSSPRARPRHPGSTPRPKREPWPPRCWPPLPLSNRHWPRAHSPPRRLPSFSLSHPGCRGIALSRTGTRSCRVPTTGFPLPRRSSVSSTTCVGLSPTCLVVVLFYYHSSRTPRTARSSRSAHGSVVSASQ